MKKGLLLYLFSLLGFYYQVYASGGFFDSFAIIRANGVTNYYDLNATTGNPDYQGQPNLGTMTPADHALILGGQIKTYKNNGTDVFGASIFYRIYPQGSPGGVFIEIPYSFQADLGVPGDQQWGTDVNGSNLIDQGVNILAGSTLPAGVYTLEVYVRVTTNGVNESAQLFDSRGGSNYQADFIVSITLPVELSSFTAKSVKDQIALSWTTESELNNSHFEIERSGTSKNWKPIGKVLGNGTTVEAHRYSFTDAAPLAGMNYYRLKQVDTNGQFEYSSVVAVAREAKGALGVFPNPASTTVDYRLTDATPIKQVQLVDLYGKVVKTATAITGTLSLDDVAQGVYMLVVENETGRYQQVVVKQ